jgi:hypothetical protein
MLRAVACGIASIGVLGLFFAFARRPGSALTMDRTPPGSANTP